MNKSKKFGLAGLVLAGLVAVSSQGCGGKLDLISITLPNGYETKGLTKQSITHKGSNNILSSEENLAEKSRVTGQILSLNTYGQNLVMQLKTANQDYLFDVKRTAGNFSPFSALEIFKPGDSISFPTIRKYDNIEYGPGYRILNNFDYIYLEEIKKIPSQESVK
jgi:hypothetical protein